MNNTLEGINRRITEAEEWKKLGLVLVGGVLLGKASIQLSADGCSCTPFLAVVWPELTQPWGLGALWQG